MSSDRFKKQIGALLALPIICLGLTACGNNNQAAKENSSLKAENSSLKAKSSANHQSKSHSGVRYSNAEYALAAFLKLQGQTADELSDNSGNMHWIQKADNVFNIDFGAHTTQMRVNADIVDVTYDDIEGDHMGQGNGHRTYSKEQLAKTLKSEKNTIDSLLSAHGGGGQDNSETQTSSAKSGSSDDSDYNLPLSDSRNPDSSKQAEMMSIAGDPKYRDTPNGSLDEAGQASISSIRSTMHNGN